MTESYFEVIKQTEYMIQIKDVFNVEEIDNNFVTDEELVDMGVNFRDDGIYGIYFLKSKIVNKINEYLADIKGEKKSTVIDDADLLDLFVSYKFAVSDFVTGARRVGNKLFKKVQQVEVKKERVVCRADWLIMLTIIEDMFENAGVIVKVLRDAKQTDCVKSVEFFKKVFSWNEIVEYINVYNHDITKANRTASYYRAFHLSEIDIAILEKLYNNPTLLQKGAKK